MLSGRISRLSAGELRCLSDIGIGTVSTCPVILLLIHAPRNPPHSIPLCPTPPCQTNQPHPTQPTSAHSTSYTPINPTPPSPPSASPSSSPSITSTHPCLLAMALRKALLEGGGDDPIWGSKPEDIWQSSHGFILPDLTGRQFLGANMHPMVTPGYVTVGVKPLPHASAQL